MNRKIFLIFLYVYALVFSVSKAVRFPNSWSEAHWMLDYRFGFIKRGLAGEVFGLFFNKNEWSILLVSSVILVVLYISLLIMAARQTFKSRQDIIWKVIFFLIFFLSQYIVFSAHLIGYLDHVIFLLAVLAVQLITYKKILLASVVIAISILVHEISFFLMLPICFFALVVNEISNGQFSPKSILFSGLLRKIGMLLALPVIVTLGISVHQEMYGGNNHFIIFTYLKQFKFIGEKAADSVAGAYTGKFSDYLADEGRYFFSRVFFSKASVMYGIPILSLLYVIYKVFQKINGYLFLLLAAVVLFPLLLHAVAWDTYRIWSFPYMILFLGFWILSSKFKNEAYSPQKVSVFEIVIFIVSILLVSLVPNILMDNETERFSMLQKILIMLPVFFVAGYYLKTSKRVF